MRQTLRRLFQLLMVMVPFAWTAQTDELFEFNKMMLTYALTIVIVMVWIWRMIAEKRIIFRKTPFLWFLLAFVISQVLSTLFSIDPHTSLFGYYSRFHGGLLSTLAYSALFAAATSNLEADDVLPLMKSLLWGSLGVVVYALPEHFGLSPSCVLIRGDFSTNCWAENTNPRYRIFGTFGQPNWLAAYLLMTFPLALAWVTNTAQRSLAAAHKSAQTLAWSALGWPSLIAGLNLVALLYTRSRSGFLGLGLSLATFAIGIFWLNRQNWLPLLSGQLRWSRQWVLAPLGLLVGGVLIMAVVGTPYTPPLTQFVSSALAPAPAATPSPTPATEETPTTGTVLENGGTDSGRIRAIVWRGTWRVWERYPLLGSGVETFAYSYYRDRPVEHNLVSEWDFLYNKAHNEFLNFLATTGIVGLGTYVALMVSFIGFVIRQVKHSTTKQLSTAIWLVALLAGYLGLAVSNFAGFSTVMVGILFFLWPAFAWLLTQPTTPPAPATRGKKSTAPPLFTSESQWIGVATVGLIGELCLLNVFSMWNNDRLLAQAKQNLALGNGLETYQQLATLTQRAPGQAEYWEQYALVLSQLAVSASANDNATAAAALAQEAVDSIDQATNRNPVHLNIWKSRARVFLFLTLLSDQYYQPAREALEMAHQLAPTDPKILYNLAVLEETLAEPEQAEAAYQQAISLKPNYEQARKAYAEFLTQQGEYQGAIDQYRYIDEVLKPQAPLFTATIASLEASLSAQLTPETAR